MHHGDGDYGHSFDRGSIARTVISPSLIPPSSIFIIELIID